MEDWQKKYYANLQKNGSSIPKEPINTTYTPANNKGEIDIGNELMQRMMAKVGNSQNMNGFLPRNFVPQPPPPQSALVKQVNLIPGKPFYRQIQTGGFAPNANLVRSGGTIVENVSKNVFMKKEVIAYLIDGISSIDMQNIHMTDQITLKLYEIEIPLIGKIFVEKDAIQETQSRNILGITNINGQILKD